MADKLRLLFIYQDESLPSSRIRVLNLIPQLKLLGVSASAVLYPKSFITRLSMFGKLKNYDAVILQKKMLSTVDLFLLKASAVKLIFDFDDAIFHRDNEAAGFLDPRREKKFSKIIKASDLVFAGTEYLAAEAYKRGAKNVSVVPSSVPVNVPEKDYTKEEAVIIVGWVGSQGNLYSLDQIASGLAKLSRSYPIKLHVISDAYYEYPGLDVQNIPWSIETQELEIAKFDIGIMPLVDNVWTRGKCGYKALQYMAAAVPPLVSAVGGNIERIKHGINGLVAHSDVEFISCLEGLIADRELRKNFGVKARETVVECCSIENVSRSLNHAVKQIM